MKTVIEWIAAEAEREEKIFPGLVRRFNFAEGGDHPQAVPVESLVRHGFPGVNIEMSAGAESPESGAGAESFGSLLDAVQTVPDGTLPETELEKFSEEARQRRIYRGRTVEMLRRFLRYSIETGRLPSVLGQEFFRAKVTTYTFVTFEDRVIFVHDMERCLELLDEFSRQLIARRVLQEHDRWATARLLHCNEKTVRRLTPLALDLLSEILLDRGLLERVETISEKSCQGGLEGQNSVSDCEQSENKF